MKRPSLRMRLALWSAALAGGALLGFALLSSWLIYQAKLDRLDARLESIGPLARPRNGNAPPPHPEMALAQGLGLSDAEDVSILAINPEGNVIYQSGQWPGPPPETWPALGPRGPQRFDRRGPHRTMTVQTPRGPWRVAIRATPVGQVAIAVNLDALRQEMVALRRIYLLTIPGLLLAIGGGAWGLAGQALRPVGQLSQTIDQVTAQGLSQRIPAAADSVPGDCLQRHA